MLPFWISIALLSLAQGAVVALPEPPQALVGRLRTPRPSGSAWGLLPPASVIAFVFIARAAEHASAQALTYLALCAVPGLAALALGFLVPRARPRLALLVLGLFALAWADRGGLAGQAAALALTALSCVALGVALALLTPRRWLAAGIVAMAVADTALVVADLLQRPNNALNAAHPAAGLPRLQSAVLGSAAMGYGDLFIAAALGALLSFAGPRLRLRGAVLTALLALCMDLLFFVVDELPATVPVAIALLTITIARWQRSSGRPPALHAASGHADQGIPAGGVPPGADCSPAPSPGT
jgi:hypothetical protein